jgi:hypothetical protein
MQTNQNLPKPTPTQIHAQNIAKVAIFVRQIRILE